GRPVTTSSAMSSARGAINHGRRRLDAQDTTVHPPIASAPMTPATAVNTPHPSPRRPWQDEENPALPGSRTPGGDGNQSGMLYSGCGRDVIRYVLKSRKVAGRRTCRRLSPTKEPRSATEVRPATERIPDRRCRPLSRNRSDHRTPSRSSAAPSRSRISSEVVEKRERGYS